MTIYTKVIHVLVKTRDSILLQGYVKGYNVYYTAKPSFYIFFFMF